MPIIGIDFDNTIVQYDAAFYDIGIKHNIIPPHIKANKITIKKYLFDRGLIENFTFLQGLVYGIYLDAATPYPKVKSVLKTLKESGWCIYVISHKTRWPIIGKKIDLRTAALNWIKNNGFTEFFEPISQQIIFNNDRDNKIQSIVKTNCDVFIDDLPEILTSKKIQDHTLKILFDPDDNYKNSGFLVANHWVDVLNIIKLNQ